MRIYRMTGLAAACGLLLVTTAPAQRSAELAKPVQVHAGGAPIDTGTDIGYAGPLFRDQDGDDSRVFSFSLSRSF